MTCPRKTKRSKRCINIRPDTRQQHPSVRGEAKTRSRRVFPIIGTFVIEIFWSWLVFWYQSLAPLPCFFFFSTYSQKQHRDGWTKSSDRWQNGGRALYNTALFIRMRPGSWSPSFFPPVPNTYMCEGLLGWIGCSHIEREDEVNAIQVQYELW